MTLNADLARVGVTGGVVKAPLGTTMPIDMSPWETPWADLGYISDDGLTEAVDADTEEFTAWQSNQPIRLEYTRETWTYQATFWESKYDTIATYYRASRSDFEQRDGGLIVLNQPSKPTRQRAAYGFDVIDGDYARRIVCPSAEVSDRDDLVYKSDTVVGYNVTITAYPVDGISVVRMFLEDWYLPDVELLAPAGVTVGTVAATTVELSWDTVSGASSYVVQLSTDAGSTWTDVAADDGGAPTGASTTVSGLTASTEYQFRVAAVNGQGTRGAWSDPVTATTTA